MTFHVKLNKLEINTRTTLAPFAEAHTELTEQLVRSASWTWDQLFQVGSMCFGVYGTNVSLTFPVEPERIFTCVPDWSRRRRYVYIPLHGDVML